MPMPKLRAVVFFLAISLASSVLTTVVAFQFFLPAKIATISGPNSKAVQTFPGVAPKLAYGAASLSKQADVSGTPDCEDDKARFCENSTLFSSTECLQDHFGQVSAGCHKTLQSMRDNLGICKDDIARYCTGVGYGGGRMANCLRQNKSHLSEACARVIGAKT